jgi:hypothetical protein
MTEQITLTVAGALVTLPSETLAALWLNKVRAGDPISTPRQCRAYPPIGEWWDDQGGYYAGLARGRDGAPDYHLLLAEPAQENIIWQAALDWVKALEIDGHRDFTLPNRSEQALLYANLKDLFTPEWYWSSEQSASYDAYAWCQGFTSGTQYYGHKSTKLRARAVRRLAIE